MSAPYEEINDTLDLLTEAGWVIGWARDAQNNYSIQWSREGENALAGLRSIVRSLGPDGFNQVVWNSIGFLAKLKFG